MSEEIYLTSAKDDEAIATSLAKLISARSEGIRLAGMYKDMMDQKAKEIEKCWEEIKVRLVEKGFNTKNVRLRYADNGQLFSSPIESDSGLSLLDDLIDDLKKLTKSLGDDT